jgi:hypothetical protein
MFGWQKRTPDPMEEQLREATLKRLAEVMGLPAEEFKPRHLAKHPPSKTPRKMTIELRLSGGY